MLNHSCKNCKDSAKYGSYHFTKRIICSCEQQFINAKFGDIVYCRIDGSTLFADWESKVKR